MPEKLLGLIAGNGKFPILFTRKAKAEGYRVVAAGVEGDTPFFLRLFADQFILIKAGELRKLFSFFKDQGVHQVIMAGQVDPKNLFHPGVKLDDDFKDLFKAMHDRKADTIFCAVANRLQSEGMELVDSTFLLKDHLAPKGTWTRRAPALKELEDIEFGRNIARAMGAIDVGQTVVVKDKAIVAIEAMEGTDRAILRGGRIAHGGAVVVKMSKPGQDMRFDVPVIGPRTIRTMARSKAGCLGIEAGKTIVIDRDTCIRLADKSGICIVAA